MSLLLGCRNNRVSWDSGGGRLNEEKNTSYLPELQTSIVHYNEVPISCIGNSVLDVGSSNSEGATKSIHGNHFLNNEYLGIDVQKFEHTPLPVICCDIFDFHPDKQFDTILCLHVLEHIPIAQWPNFFTHLNTMLKNGGHIVVNVPYKCDGSSNSLGPMKHEVLQITETLLLRYWPFQNIFQIGKIPYRLIRRAHGENLLWVFGRFVTRIFTNHKYSAVRRYIASRQKARLVAIYHKGNEQIRNDEK